MKVTYDPQVDALYIHFRDVPAGAVETREMAEGVSADFGADGKIVGIEVLDARLLFGDSGDKVIMEPLSRS